MEVVVEAGLLVAVSVEAKFVGTGSTETNPLCSASVEAKSVETGSAGTKAVGTGSVGTKLSEAALSEAGSVEANPVDTGLADSSSNIFTTFWANSVPKRAPASSRRGIVIPESGATLPLAMTILTVGFPRK